MVDISEITLRAKMDDYGIPGYMQPGLLRWITEGGPVGHFLSNLISNDLKRTLERADDTNVKLIHNYVKFLYNHAPSECWGSKENFENWPKKFAARTPTLEDIRELELDSD